MSGQLRRFTELNLLAAGGMITVIAIAVPSAYFMFSNNRPHRWLGMGLLLAFALLSFASENGRLPSRGAIHAYLAVQTGIVIVLALLEPQLVWFFILFFVLSAEAPSLLHGREWLWWILIFIAVMAIFVVRSATEPFDYVTLPIYAGGFFFFAAFARQTALANEARAESQRLLQELQTAHERLQDYATQSEEWAVAEERNRLAREMHDTLGHRLTVSAVQLQAAERLVETDPGKAGPLIATVREQVREALRELRASVASLRIPLEADLGLPSALSRLCASFEDGTGIAVHLMVADAMPELPQAHRLVLYRAAQEGLTNVQRHAQASDAWVQVELRDSSVSLMVSDNGRGLPVEQSSSGFGLLGLRERAGHLGGHLRLDPRAGGGTRLTVTLPLPIPDAHKLA